MTTTATTLRRTALITLMSLAAAAAFAWWRQRNEMAMPAEPPQWPAFVAPEPPVATWVPSPSDGTPPEGFPVKVKVSSGIFHVPGGRFYDRTNPDRWYATADAAQADGYRQSKT
jgi:hypothetical protein